MGYNTTIVLLNDSLGDLARDQEFGAKLAEAVSHLAIERPIDVCVGCCANGALVLETHHADQLLPVMVGGNGARVITDTYVRWNSDDPEMDLLRALAKKHGFTLRKKPKP